jgi:hypothetical protein
MALISLSGIGKAKKKAGARMISESQIKRTPQKPISKKAQKKAERKAKVQAKKKVILAKIKKVGKVAIKYNPLVATARNAFLALVSLNVFNLAKRLNIMLVKNPKKLMDFWTGLSGKFSALQEAVNKGKNKKAIIGAVAVATTVTTATPILVKVTKFLAENGIGPEEIKAIKKAVIPVIAKAVDKKITKEAEKEVEEEEEEEAPQETTSEDTSSEDQSEDTSSEDTSEDQSEDTSSEDQSEDGQMGYYC